MTEEPQHDLRDEARAPSSVRRAGIGFLVVAVAGAVYLIAMRGEAIVVDLASLGAKFFCF